LIAFRSTFAYGPGTPTTPGDPPVSEPIKPLDLDVSTLPGYGDLSEDELYAPADVSEIPAAALSVRPSTPVATVHPSTPVATLTNSPGCAPTLDARPIRRARSVRTDAWSSTAPASWGRSRRTVRKVQGRGRGSRGVNASPSTDWSLPF